MESTELKSASVTFRLGTEPRPHGDGVKNVRDSVPGSTVKYLCHGQNPRIESTDGSDAALSPKQRA